MEAITNFIFEYWKICLLFIGLYILLTTRKKRRNVSIIKGDNNHVIQTWNGSDNE
jgi:hypothetical protein